MLKQLLVSMFQCFCAPLTASLLRRLRLVTAEERRCCITRGGLSWCSWMLGAVGAGIRV